MKQYEPLTQEEETRFYDKVFGRKPKEQRKSDCLHDNCMECDGTGIRKDGRGICVHAISCPCKKCNPFTL